MTAESLKNNEKVVKIGVIVAGSAPPIEGFKEGLTELGWIEEQNVDLVIRVAQGQAERLPGFASEIVALNVDVIAVIGAVTVRGRSESYVDYSDCLFSVKSSNHNTERSQSSQRQKK